MKGPADLESKIERFVLAFVKGNESNFRCYVRYMEDYIFEVMAKDTELSPHLGWDGNIITVAIKKLFNEGSLEKIYVREGTSSHPNALHSKYKITAKGKERLKALAELLKK